MPVRRHQHETPSRLLVVASAVLLAASVTACTPGGAGPSASSSPTATVTAAPTAPSPTATPTPAPEIPGGDASANLERFTDVVEGVWDAGRSVAGRDYIDALVDAGMARVETVKGKVLLEATGENEKASQMSSERSGAPASPLLAEFDAAMDEIDRLLDRTR